MALATHQRDAFGRFYRENLPALRGYVARLLRGSAEADDDIRSNIHVGGKAETVEIGDTELSVAEQRISQTC